MRLASLLVAAGHIAPVRRPRRGRFTVAAQHPLDHQRGQRPSPGLLRRHVRDDAEPRRLAAREPDATCTAGRTRPSAPRPGPRSSQGCTPPSTGSEHMRSSVRMPAGMRMYPQFLREAGYYCTNNSKEDYNLESRARSGTSRRPRRTGRTARPASRSSRSSTSTSRTRARSANGRTRRRTTRPRSACPRTTPTCPRCARTGRSTTTRSPRWTRIAGKHLDELDEAGLADDTIVFYYGDHGSGMPRNKRSPCNSGLHVPLIVHVPEKFKHLAPKDYTPGAQDGSTRAVRRLRPDAAEPRRAQAAGVDAGPRLPGNRTRRSRSRTSSASAAAWTSGSDLVRSVCDGRYVYVRELHAAHPRTASTTPTCSRRRRRVAWKQLFDEGKLTPQQAQFWQAREPPRSCTTWRADPDEVKNLAASREHRDVLSRLRKASAEHVVADARRGVPAGGGDPQPLEGLDAVRRGAGGGQDPLNRIHVAAAVVGEHRRRRPGACGRSLPRRRQCRPLLGRPRDDGRGKAGVRHRASELRTALRDESPYVRAAAAEALGRHGGDEDCTAALPVLLDLADVKRHGIYVSVAALNALDALDRRAEPGRRTRSPPCRSRTRRSLPR